MTCRSTAAAGYCFQLDQLLLLLLLLLVMVAEAAGSSVAGSG
jgi:hypothetical protein